MENCLFCKIIKGEVPATKVYEDKNVVAFLDINPVNLGHTLVLPKEHFEDFLSCPDEILKEIIIAMKKVAKGIVEGLELEGFNIEQNNGKVAGQIIPHLHFHIIPRKSNDGLKHWIGKEYREGEMDDVLDKIKSKI